MELAIVFKIDEFARFLNFKDNRNKVNHQNYLANATRCFLLGYVLKKRIKAACENKLPE